MATNKLQWKRIAKGDRLPCDSLLMEKDGTIIPIITGAGVKVDQDTHYLPVEELMTLQKEESKDERIRKALIKLVKKAGEGYENVIDGVSIENAISWLEKQGGKKLEVKYVYTKFRIGDVIVEIKLNGYCQPVRVKYVGEESYLCESDDGKRSLSFPITSQDEYKLIDKVEPKFKVGDKIKLAKESKYPAREIIAIKNDAYYFDKFVHLPFSRQDEWELVGQKSSWSEEDESHLCGLIGLLEDVSKNKKRDFRIISDNEKDDIEHWLKSIKDRVQAQSQWKPSEEQMIALKCAITTADEKWVCLNTKYLESLYEDLKKLKG